MKNLAEEILVDLAQNDILKLEGQNYDIVHEYLSKKLTKEFNNKYKKYIDVYKRESQNLSNFIQVNMIGETNDSAEYYE